MAESFPWSQAVSVEATAVPPELPVQGLPRPTTGLKERATEVVASDSARERRDLVSELVRLFEKRNRDS